MASQVMLWQWTTTASGWVGVSPANSRAEFTSAVGSPVGSLRLTASGRTSSPSPFFYWEGSWANLGIPADAVVYGVGLASGMWRCSSYSTGANSTAGPWLLTDISTSTTQATLWAGSAYSASTVAWTTLASGASVGIGTLGSGSTDTLRLSLEGFPATANSATASNHLAYDNFAITIYYNIAQARTIIASGQDLIGVLGNPALAQITSIDSGGLLSSEDYGQAYLGAFGLTGSRSGTNIELTWVPQAWI